MEFLFGLLVRFPSLFQALGLALVSISFAAIGLGLRLGKGLDRIERAAARSGVSVELNLNQMLPPWLGPFIPSTGWGFAAWTTAGVIGLMLAITAKRIRKAYY